MEQQLCFDIEADELQIFLEEVNELLQTMENGILDLEQAPDPDILKHVFRAAHTLKALAGTVGHSHMAELTHTMETLFDAMRESRLRPTQVVIDDLLAALDILKAQRDEIITGDPSGVNAGSMLQRLIDLGNNGGTSNAPGADETLVPASLLPEEATLALAYSNTDHRLYEIAVSVSQDAFAPAARLAQAAMAVMEAGEIIVQRPSMAELANKDGQRRQRLQILMATRSEVGDIERLLNEIADLAGIQVKTFFMDSVKDVPAGASLAKSNGKAKENGVSPTPAGAGIDIGVDQTVRISVHRLDSLMNLVGELITDRNRLVRIDDVLRLEHAGSSAAGELSEMTSHVGRVVDQLQEEVMRTRMMPISHIFAKLPRLVRDVARIAGKQVNLTIEGEGTELDRSLLEVIGDPLIHLLRNAVDHGIEKPEERILAGKPPEGNVRLAAAHEEGHIVLTISDDGAGIDEQRVRKAAISRGLISKEEAAQLGYDEIIDLIFRPSLSTREKVTEVSGRGIGLDVVRNNVERLSGTVTVESRLGTGTTFHVILPLTLAIVDTMLVALGDDVYAVPLTGIIDTQYLSQVTTKTLKGNPVILWRGTVLPLLDLRLFFAHPRARGAPPDGLQPAVVTVGWGRQRVGLIADGIIGKQGIVVKSLGPVIGEVPGILGSAILGDGRIALIVDVPSLIGKAFQTRKQG